MNASLRLILALALFGAAPIFAAKSAGKPSTPAPSVRLRHMIDTTLPKLGNITNPKQTINQTPLTEAQADFTARAITAAPAQQAMYQAAASVVANLIGAVQEHNKAVSDFHYSKNVHGAQDRQNEDISNPQHGWDAGAVARANNAKQNKENADSRKALLDKEKFMSNGTVATWTQRVGQLQEIIEQSYAAELIAEKQMAMVTAPVPAPAPRPASTPQPSSAQQYSPVGTWQAGNGARLLLNEDNTASRGVASGTWAWTNQGKGALHITWKKSANNVEGADLNFSADGQTLSGTNSGGIALHFTRGN
jgi:hypothetical protein